MGIFGRIGRYFKNLALTDEKAWNPSLWNFASGQTNAGENVTEETALKYSAVFNAIALISGTVGSLPLHLMRRKGNKTSIADEKSIYRILHTAANPYMTAMTFRETMMGHVLAWGNGYAEILRTKTGTIDSLWPITPNRIRPDMDGDKLSYIIRVDNEDIRLPREKILHIPGLGFDGYQGYSVIAMAKESIGLGKAMETFGSKYFGQGTHPGVIVSHPGKLSEPAHKNLKDSLVAAYSGLGQAHRLMLLEEDMKIANIGIPPNDSQFLESRQFQIPEIARWFNLPPHKLKDLTRSSFSNIESEQISFVTDSILPWLIRLEQNYNMQLLSLNDQKRLYFKHVVEGLLRGNSKDRADYYSKMFNIGAMCINEIRGKEDMNPIPGGDIHLVPLNMISLENAGKPIEPTPKAIPETTEEKADENEKA